MAEAKAPLDSSREPSWRWVVVVRGALGFSVACWCAAAASLMAAAGALASPLARPALTVWASPVSVPAERLDEILVPAAIGTCWIGAAAAIWLAAAGYCGLHARNRGQVGRWFAPGRRALVLLTGIGAGSAWTLRAAMAGRVHSTWLLCMDGSADACMAQRHLVYIGLHGGLAGTIMLLAFVVRCVVARRYNWGADDGVAS